MKEYGVYRILNKQNGQMYIGLTSNSFEHRWKEHIRELNNNEHHNSYLQRSWNKYGEESFEFAILHLCDELDDIGELEKYYINKYNTYHDGYNMTLGGESPMNVPDEARLELIRKIKDSMRKNSQYTINQIENVKILLSKGYKVKTVSKKTGVNESIVLNIKYLKTWVDIRKDLNEIIYNENQKQDRNNEIIHDFQNGMTINELSNKYNLCESSLYYIFKKEKIAYRQINDKNKDKARSIKMKIEEESVMKVYNTLDSPTFQMIEKETGIYYDKIKRILINNNVSLDEIKLNRKCEKQAEVIGVRYNKSADRWYAEIGVDGQCFYIGSSKTQEEAEYLRKNAENILEANGKDGLLNYISSLREVTAGKDYREYNQDEELSKYKEIKPMGIRYKTKDTRFEVYYNKKYIGSSKLLNDAMKIREEYVASL